METHEDTAGVKLHPTHSVTIQNKVLGTILGWNCQSSCRDM